MIEIKFIYSDLNDFYKITNLITNGVFLTTIDEKSKRGKKEAYNLKSEWGARETPFALALEGDKVIKAFYSEAEDVLNSLIKFLKDYESKCN